MKVFFTEILQDEALGVWPSMSAEKRASISRMRRKEDAQVALAAHRMLCYTLKKTYGIAPKPEDWQKEEHGKPYLANIENIHFNISHSGRMAMCAIDTKPVGVDIEKIKPYSDNVARRIMSAEEWRAFAVAQNKEEMFYKIWTLKEAYLKYTGDGISALGDITVYPSDDGIKTNADGCTFALIDDIPGYQAAVCAQTVDFTLERLSGEALIKNW